jgi:hypothetical protein
MPARHPLIGTWRVAVTIPGAPAGLINLARLSADGGVAAAFPSPTPAAPGAAHTMEFWSPALGSWSATDERGAALIFVSLGADEHGAYIGTHTVSATISLDAGDATWSGSFQFAIAGPDGAALGTVAGTIHATRISAGAHEGA